MGARGVYVFNWQSGSNAADLESWSRSHTVNERSDLCLSEKVCLAAYVVPVPSEIEGSIISTKL